MVSGCEDAELAFPGNTQENSPGEPKGSIVWAILYDENNVGQLPENLQGTNTTLGSIDVVDTNPDDEIKLVTIQSQKINGNNRNLFTVMKDSSGTWKVVLLSSANIDYETIHDQNGSSTQSEIVMEITDDSPTEEKGTLAVSVLITNVNESPEWDNTSIGTTADEGILYESPAITWSDVDHGGSHTLSSDDLPDWLTIDVNKKLTGTPSTADVNSSTSFTLKLQDQGGLEITKSFTIDVRGNEAPGFDGSLLNDTWEEEISDSWNITFTDPNDADYSTLTAEISSSLGLTLQQNYMSGTVSGILPHSYVDQEVTFQITLNDNRNGNPLTTTETFTIYVDPNDPPSFNGPLNDTWEEEISDSWYITFTDPDPNNADYSTLTAEISSSLGLTLQQNYMSGTVSGILPHSYVDQEVTFQITLNDNRNGNPLTTTETFTIYVDPNDPPEFTNTENIIQLIHHGCQYYYDVNWTDPDGDGVTFEGSESIGWLNVNTSSGILSGTPAESDIGASGSVLLTIADNRPNVPLSTDYAFTITVDQNYAPQFDNIESVDSTATVGSQYSFQFGISDENSDDFVFTVPTRPSWLYYNSYDYRIYGTPSLSDTSATHNVTVQAADCGQETSFSFSIEVTN